MQHDVTTRADAQFLGGCNVARTFELGYER